MDDDEDYFTPTMASSRRLAMLFSTEETTSSSSSSRTSNHSSPSTQFKFVAPKQPRSTHNSPSVSASSCSGQPALGDSQEVLLEVPLILLPHGTEKNGMPRTRVSCQVVGIVTQQSFSLVVAMIEQAKGELWRVAIDSYLTLEVVEHSTVKVMAHTSEMLTLVGEAQQIEALVTQVAICRGVASSRVTQQDLHTGRGHVLAEGDVAKVTCTTYAITATTCRGEKVGEVKGVKVTVSAPTVGSWESCLAGASADSHRLIFLPKHKNGDWQPPTQYHDVKVAKVKTKGSREKAVGGARSGSQPQEQQQTLTSHDVPLATNPPSVTETRIEAGDSQEHNAGEEEDVVSRKAALVTRMAQVGTQIFPLLPSARPVPQSQVKPPVAERSRGTSAEVWTVSPSTPHTTTPTLASTNPTPATTFVSAISSSPVLIATTTTTTPVSTLVSSSAPATVTSTGFIPAYTFNTTTTSTTTMPGLIPGLASATHPHAPVEARDTTLAHGIGQLGTTVTKIADRVELLFAMVERVEAKSQVEAEGGCVPETLMALASGLVAHNERLKTQLEVTEKKLVESQAAQTSLLAMNTQLLDEKREMLRKEAELRDEVANKEEELKKKVTEDIKTQEKKEDKEKSRQRETEPYLTPKEIQSLVKATLNGLFHHMASDFSKEETHYSQPQVLQTLRSGLEVAYSSFVENLEKMTEEEAEEEQEQEELGEGKGEQEEGGQEGEKERRQGEKDERREEEMNGENSPGQDSMKLCGRRLSFPRPLPSPVVGSRGDFQGTK